MQAKGWIMLRVLINHFYGGLSQDLIGKFPKSDLKKIKKIPVRCDDAARALLPAAQCLERIHYSWLSPHIENMPSTLQKITLGALSKKQRHGVCKQLGLPALASKPSEPVARYVLSALYRRISPEEHLPARYLPHSHLNLLGEYTKSQLLRMIDLLGVRDLVPWMKQTVRSKNQEVILRCLTQEQEQLLHYYLRKQKEKISLQPIQLQDWDGNSRVLRTRIHHKGLVRLGKALSGQDETLIWYILHTLDTGRAAIVKKNSAKAPIADVTIELLKQVVSIMNYLEKQK